jgi:hypothetical protein
MNKSYLILLLIFLKSNGSEKREITPLEQLIKVAEQHTGFVVPAEFCEKLLPELKKLNETRLIEEENRKLSRENRILRQILEKTTELLNAQEEYEQDTENTLRIIESTLSDLLNSTAPKTEED